MSSIRSVSVCGAAILFLLPGATGVALAQGWGEQAPMQFKYSNQGLSNEVYRNQLGAAAAAASASASGGGLGTAQGNNQLSNVVQVTNSNTYNVNVAGDGNVLNMGDTVNAQQTSSDSNQTNANTNTSTKQSASGSSQILNK
jgi:hypothetical protein